MEDAITHASSKLGIKEITSQQKKAVQSFFTGHDVFVSLPTGSGKSFIFESAPICVNFVKKVSNSVALVISPIKALVDDQVSKLKAKGIYAGSLEDMDITDQNLSIIFASPESILQENASGRDKILSMRERICGIFVDECHIVPKWGQSSIEKEAFRKHFSMLGEVRALIPSRVPLIALTATATEDVTKSNIKTLAMYDVVYVFESPDRSNIKYVSVRAKNGSYEDWFQWLIKYLKDNGRSAERMIIYCRTLAQCRDLYAYFDSELEYVESEYKAFAMFHSETESAIQASIVKSFSRPDGHIRVLFSTIAFGMGIDVKGLYTIIHLGVPSDVESFLQESGRAGRDSKQSTSTLFMPGMYKDCKVTEQMKSYASNVGSCRRKEILQHFMQPTESLGNHRCCDICAASCECGDEDCSNRPMAYESLTKVSHKSEKLDNMDLPTRIMSDAVRENLKAALLQHRLQKLTTTSEEDKPVNSSSDSAHYLAGADIASGIPLHCIDDIVKKSHYVQPYSVFLDRYPIYTNARSVYDIIQDSTRECLIESPVDVEKEDDTSSSVTEISDEETSDLEDDGLGKENVYFQGEYANIHMTYSSDESQSDDFQESEEDEDEDDEEDD